MTSPQPEAVAAVLAVYQQQTQSLRVQIEAFIRALWRSLPAYREPQMRDFTRQVVPVVLGAQQHMVGLTSAYLQQYQQAAGETARLAAVDPKTVTGSAARNGTEPVDVYGRPFHLVWRDLAAAQKERDRHYNWTLTPDSLAQPPLPPADYVDKAIRAGADRAVNLAHTDLQLSKVQTSQQVLRKNANIVGYKRVLEGPHSCGLCIVASTQRYHLAKLMPIHPGCDCSVAPIIGGENINLVIDEQRLSDVHQAIVDRFGESSPGARDIPGQNGLKYGDVLIEHTNSELGPVLAVRGQKFSTLNNI